MRVFYARIHTMVQCDAVKYFYQDFFGECRWNDIVQYSFSMSASWNQWSDRFWKNKTDAFQSFIASVDSVTELWSAKFSCLMRRLEFCFFFRIVTFVTFLAVRMRSWSTDIWNSNRILPGYNLLTTEKENSGCQSG